MDTFLDELKARHQEAAKAFQSAQADLQAAQAKFNLASQRLNALGIVLNGEQQRVAQEAEAETARQPKFAIDLKIVPAPVQSPPSPVSDNTATSATATESDGLNKTDLIRAVLGQHPKGITANQIWKELKDSQISGAYVHSVLHRLKKRGQVSRRLGRYMLKTPQPEEVASQNGAVDVA